MLSKGHRFASPIVEPTRLASIALTAKALPLPYVLHRSYVASISAALLQVIVAASLFKVSPSPSRSVAVFSFNSTVKLLSVTLLHFVNRLAAVLLL
ncbi:hypothetical protein J1N35_029433 [Gossypium stocksii]|uniref:Uncharacterized protein n=1 Tax=Gossypium stocksii TaxID=47602 RepID=A0A9D3ZS20_9ROSI|nr:hypothetical protein J1N35_029433 [Gossypium stocksii]